VNPQKILSWRSKRAVASVFPESDIAGAGAKSAKRRKRNVPRFIASFAPRKSTGQPFHSERPFLLSTTQQARGEDSLIEFIKAEQTAQKSSGKELS
jgi:hypothetical protein